MLLHQLTLGDLQELKAREINYDTDLKPLIYSNNKPLVRLADPDTKRGGGWFGEPMKHNPKTPKNVKIIRVFVGDNKVRHDDEWDQKVTNTTLELNLPWKDGKYEYKGTAHVGQSVSIYFCIGASIRQNWRNFYFGDMKIQAIADHEKVCKVHFVVPSQYSDVHVLKRQNNYLECTNERLKRARKSETEFLRNRSANMASELQSKLDFLDECKTQISNLKQDILEARRSQQNDGEKIRNLEMCQRLQEYVLKKHVDELNELRKKCHTDEFKKLLKRDLNKSYGQRLLTALDAHFHGHD